MLDTLELLYELRETFDARQAESLARVMGKIYKELANTVTKVEFEELRKTVAQLADNVKELAEAQKRTEKRINELAEAQKRTEERLNELAEAQKRTEERLNRLEEVVEKLAEAQKRTEERLNELAEAQKRTEERLNRLEEVVEKLAEAQKRTEERVNELAEAQKRTEERLNRLEEVVEKLAEAQKRTEERVNELAEAQKKTEDAIKRLVGELEEVKEQVGGLSHTVGYTLENEAYKALPALLKRDYNLEVLGKLKRGYIKDSKGQAIEVNIIGEAKRNGKKVFIVGESKVKLSKNDVRRFIERRIKRLEPVLGELFPLIVTHMISEPDVEEFAKEKGVVVYYSYDF